MEDRDSTRFGLFTILEDRGMELDVVALPDSRGLARIDQRLGHAVDAATVVVLAVESIAIENLHFISALHVHTAVDRKSTRLNSSHLGISYAVFCLKKK